MRRTQGRHGTVLREDSSCTMRAEDHHASLTLLSLGPAKGQEAGDLELQGIWRYHPVPGAD